MRNLTLLFLVISLCSCQINQDKKVESFSDFKTDESTKLYFKNVRRSYYDVTELETAKLETYRFKKRVQDDLEPIINLAIVNNWRFDEAYVLLEPNGKFIGGMDDIQVRWYDNSEELTAKFENTNKESHLAFADIIYNNVISEKEMEVWNGNEWLKFLTTSKAKEAFRISMYDYYRLVNRL